jgi:hypothetical protein
MIWWSALDGFMRKVVALSVLALILVLILFTVSFCHQRDKAARSSAENRTSQAQAGLGSDAAIITDAQTKAESENASITTRNRDDILNADNAHENAGDAGDAGLRSVCNRVLYRDSPRCVELRRTDRANAAR